MQTFPCKTCCELDMSCCHNPQITWTVKEFDKLVQAKPEILQNVVIIKGDMPGLIYVLDKQVILSAGENNNVNLDYCAFYDTEKNCCSVYEHRPIVCSTYGDPQYNACPYEGLSDEGLALLVKEDKAKAVSMHKTAFSNPIKYGVDHVIPFVASFIETQKENSEYMEWWESLPVSNFIRK